MDRWRGDGLEHEEECWFVRLLPDGTPIVRIRGAEREIEIDGLAIPQPPKPLYFEIFSRRLARLHKPLRCTVRSMSTAGRVRVLLRCYGWHDKSGDVWIDLALVLLDEGVARVAGGEFPEREEYLRHERERRSHDRVRRRGE